MNFKFTLNQSNGDRSGIQIAIRSCLERNLSSGQYSGGMDVNGFVIGEEINGSYDHSERKYNNNHHWTQDYVCAKTARYDLLMCLFILCSQLSFISSGMLTRLTTFTRKLCSFYASYISLVCSYYLVTDIYVCM